MDETDAAAAGNAKTHAKIIEAGNKMAAGSVIPTRPQVEAFMRDGVFKMNSDETRQLLKDPALSMPGLKLIELQRAGWDIHNIDADVGCQVLDEIEGRFPGDEDLVKMRVAFVETAQRTYVRAIEDRRPEQLERKKGMSREKIIEFFDVCNTKTDLPEFHQYLMKHMEDTKQVPNKLIAEMQRDYLEFCGFERDHGCKELSKIPQGKFKDDKEIIYRFQDWQQKATRCCMSVVKEYQKTGGEMPQGPVGDNAGPALQEFGTEAREEIDKMSPEERGVLLQTMTKKFEVLQNLPPDARQEYLKKLPDADRKEFAKAQILIMSVMRQQWEATQRSAQAQATPPPKGGGGGGYGGDDASKSAGAPSQQQMM